MKGVQASAGGGWSLNESPSEKEGKFGVVVGDEERHGCPQ